MVVHQLEEAHLNPFPVFHMIRNAQRRDGEEGHREWRGVAGATWDDPLMM
jgi:hypothetical protein